VHALREHGASLAGGCGAAGGGERAGTTGGDRGDPGAGYGWAVGQAEGAGRAGGAHSRGQRQWPDLSACGGTERGARGRMGRLAGTRPSRGAGPAEAARYLLGWGQRAPGVLTECASVGGTAALRMAHLAEPERRSGAGGESGGAGRVQSGG